MAKKPDQASEREASVERIIKSSCPHKVIVAGAGTGKTYTFKRLLEQMSGEGLAITFLNALANDMAKKLGDLAETRTFHSLCRKLLHHTESDGISTKFHFFTKLIQVVAADSIVLAEKAQSAKELRAAFQSLKEHDGWIEFFLDRASFYDAVGFDDSVYRMIVHFRENPDGIPSYDQVVVDEYQDFNPLEVEFIDHLETSNAVMIVGDDDQAIYDFKAASPEHLRKKVADASYEKHDLPFCSRCTDVVVRSCNAFIEEAINNGCLTGRIARDYSCYLPGKEEDNENYPEIIQVSCSVQTRAAPYIGRYVEDVVNGIPEQEIADAVSNRYPLALVIGPTHYLDRIYEYLETKFDNVVFRKGPSKDLTFLDGYRVLLEDEEANLAWRVISLVENLDASDKLLEEAIDKGCPLLELIAEDHRVQHLERLQLLRKIVNNEALEGGQQQELETYFGLAFQELVDNISFDSESDEEAAETDESNEADAERPEIRLTTFNGCKGMSAGFTFVVGLDDGEIPKVKDQPTDSEVCQFIVALTRTRKQCHLISTGMFAGTFKNASPFINWIPKENRKIIRVNKKYWDG